MPDDTQNQQHTSPPETPKAETPPAEATKVEAKDTADGVKVEADGKVTMLSPSAYKRIKEQAKAKGAKDAFLNEAKKHGYNTIETYLAAVDAALNISKKPGAEKPTKSAVERQDPGPAPDHLNDKQAQAWNKERVKIVGELEKTRREKAHYEKKYRQERQTREKTEANMALREAAILAGCQDPGVAVYLLERDMEGKTEDDLKSFDEKKYFADLKEKKPFLFGEVTKPATTGHSQAAAPQAPRPGIGSTPTIVDARKLNQTDYQELLRKRGWNSNA